MKNFLRVPIIASILVLSAVPVVLAATVSRPAIPASAEVSGAMDLTVVLKKNDFNGADITSMNFGTLQPFENPVTHGKTLRSLTSGSTGTAAVMAWITPNSHGLPYTIRQTGTALSNGAVSLPVGACAVRPVYVNADNGNQSMPAGSSLGAAGTWVSTDKLLYQSEPGASSMRTVRAYYAITDDPTAGATDAVLLGQSTGVYNGTVTITMTA